MSWIAEYDTQGREFPTCVHVTKTTGTMTHGATYVPIEDGKAVRAENAKLREQGARLFDKTLELGTENELLRELVRDMWRDGMCECDELGACAECEYHFTDRMRELGVDA